MNRFVTLALVSTVALSGASHACRLQSETAQLFEPDGYQLGGCGLICCVKDGGGKVIPS